jgi:hypothetical protein
VVTSLVIKIRKKLKEISSRHLFFSQRTTGNNKKNVISGKCNLKARVPQGSIIVPFLFLICIDDIADEMIG